MKINNLIPLVIFLGVAILFFFPNPESHLLMYLSIFLFFVALVIYLIIKSRKK